MSSAIDFDLSSAKASTRQSAFQTSQKERLLKDIVPTEFRQQRAKIATDADTPDPADTSGLCGFGKPNPCGRVIEGCSACLSLICFLVTIIYFLIAVSATDDSKMAKIRLSREVMLYTNKYNMTQAMRHIQTQYTQYCKTVDYSIDLQVPMWDSENAQLSKTLSNNTSFGMSVNIHSSTISLFYVALPIYLFAFVFQYSRYKTYCTPHFPQGLYKPWLGPDFSRWLEYLFTSPFQIFIVSTSFGFSNSDTVISQCGMQAALVLLGYNIEQQVKKLYKHRKSKQTEQLLQEVYANDTFRRYHHIFWPTVSDIRGWVYLFVAWFLHINIWNSIYTRFMLQDTHAQRCEANMKSRIPDVIKYILTSQFVLFTLFGVVNSMQYILANFGKQRSAQEQRNAWNFVSQCYAVLSVTAKTMLQVGFVWYVAEYTTWPLARDSSVVHSILPNGQQCSSMQYK